MHFDGSSVRVKSESHFMFSVLVVLILTLTLDFLHLAVVNLTLIDLPGLTKVAVGMFSFQC